MRLHGNPPYHFERPYDLYDGAKVRFVGEKQAYTVICTSNRYTICTKPFNPQHTVLYTIIDWQEQVRGPEDLIFGMGAETKEQCLEMLVRLTDGHPGRSEVSSRRNVWLNIEKLWHDGHIMIGEGAETFKQYLDRISAKRKAQDERNSKRKN
jgi:hypothetical protein